MTFRDYKKTLAVVGILAIFFPSVFLFAPKKAQAIVPVLDAPVGVSTAATAASTAIIAKSYVAKEYALDTIAYAIAKQVLHALTQSVVNWIRSGFQGNPLFITDFGGFMADQVDQATGRFMKEFLSPEVYNTICSPFRLQLRLALSRRYTYADRMRCTLSSVLTNMENFYNNFSQGGWQGWISMTGSPQNNPYGAFIVSFDELISRQTEAKNNAQTESIFNQGFLSMKKCVDTKQNYEMHETEYDSDGNIVSSTGVPGTETCLNSETTSPGKWISDQLSTATGIDFQSLAVADELNEIITALISQLLTGILRR